MTDITEAQAEAAAWLDKYGDVWVFPGDGMLGHSPETVPMPRDWVERKCGPLVPLVPAAPVVDVEKLAEVIAASYANSQGLKIRDDMRTAKAVADYLNRGAK